MTGGERTTKLTQQLTSDGWKADTAQDLRTHVYTQITHMYKYCTLYMAQ